MFIRICFFLLFYTAHAENRILFLVDAPHLDYSTPERFLRTMAKRKHRDVGHAWICLEGEIDGQSILCEGGHSGELGLYQPTYLNGLLDNAALGAKDPISYFFCAQEDGFFQKGNGGHHPTFCAGITLTDEKMKQVWDYIRKYPYRKYSLTGNQCCTLVKEVAELLGIRLDISRTVQIPPKMRIKNRWLPLWSDPKYSTLTFACPDKLEEELKNAVKHKKLYYNTELKGWQ